MSLTKVNDRGLNYPLSLLDNEKIRLGTGNDLQIYHDGNSRLVHAGAGVFSIQGNDVRIHNPNANEFMAKFVENGAVELYYDNVLKLDTTASAVRCNDNLIMGNHSIELNDNSQIMLGNAPDMRIYHDGGHSYITATTGDLTLVDESRIKLRTNQFVLNNHASDESIIYAAADGEVSLYHNGTKRFDTTGTGAKVFGQLNFDDGSSTANTNGIGFGSSQDCRLFHDGSSFQLRNVTGPISFITPSFFRLAADSSNDTMFKAIQDGAVELYYDNVRKLRTYSGGIIVSSDASHGRLVFQDTDGNYCFQFAGYDVVSYGAGGGGVFQDATGAVVLDMRGSGTNINCHNNFKLNGGGNDDNLKLMLGAGDDLQIYHDGTHSRIVDNGANATSFQTNLLRIHDNSGNFEYLAEFAANGAVKLFYDNVLKLATESTGVAIEGKMHSGHDMPTVGQTSFHTVDQAIIGTKHVLTAYHNSTSTSNSPLALNSVIPTNSAGEITIIAGWSNGNGLRIRKFAYVASGNTSVTEIYNHFNSRYGVSVSISTPTPSISGDYVNFSIGFSDSQGAKVEKLKVHVEYFKQFNI